MKDAVPRKAKLSQESLAKLEEFFTMIESLQTEDIEVKYLTKEVLLSLYFNKEYESVREDISRLLWGYQMLINNYADPGKTYLQIKPHIKEAMDFYEAWTHLPRWVGSSLQWIFSQFFWEESEKKV